MRIILKSGIIKDAPNSHVRVSLIDEPREVRRFAREKEKKILEIGIGKREEMNARKAILLCRSIVQTAKANKCKNLAIQLEEIHKLPSIQIAAENFEMANFEFNIFKTRPTEGWNNVEEILLFSKHTTVEMEKSIQRGYEVGKAVNSCRALSNTPGGDMTPTLLAKAAKDAVKDLPVKVTTLGIKELKKLKMGAILGVAKGSSEEPTFTIMEYRPSTGSTSSPQANARGKNDKGPIVFAGKGVTFDSGGLNLKPSNSIYEMHMDMSGAASVIYAVQLAAKLKLQKHVIGLLPSVENLPGNNAYRPGDVLKSMSGKTIEVLDTDAEGRLILADALTYAKRFKPSVVIDIATLTGAAHIALGDHASALLTRDDTLADKISSLGEESGDYVWRLPLWDEYEERVKGEFADLKNVPGGSTSRHGGAIDAGMFLWQFAKELDCPWAHIDMAPKMTSVPADMLSKGAAGAPVRLLVRFIEQWTQ